MQVSCRGGKWHLESERYDILNDMDVIAPKFSCPQWLRMYFAAVCALAFPGHEQHIMCLLLGQSIFL